MSFYEVRIVIQQILKLYFRKVIVALLYIVEGLVIFADGGAHKVKLRLIVLDLTEEIVRQVVVPLHALAYNPVGKAFRVLAHFHVNKS